MSDGTEMDLWGRPRLSWISSYLTFNHVSLNHVCLLHGVVHDCRVSVQHCLLQIGQSKFRGWSKATKRSGSWVPCGCSSRRNTPFEEKNLASAEMFTVHVLKWFAEGIHLWLRVSKVNEVPISSHIWVYSTTFKKILRPLGSISFDSLDTQCVSAT